MRFLVPCLALLLGLLPAPVGAAEWKPAKGPLLTKWTAEVRPDKVLPEYPRPQLVRKDWQNLNGLWQFAFGKKGEVAPFGKELSGQILVPFPVESALSGVMKAAERLWYRRTFTVPKEWGDQRVLLHFGAVDWETTVWVNGTQLGVHRGGYDPFTFDITEALKGSADQELIVGVFDPTDGGTQPRGKQVGRPEGIYYTPTTGIWQTVWLEPVPQASIARLKINPSVDDGKVLIEVETRGTSAGPLRFKATVKDGAEQVASLTSQDRHFAIPLPGAKRWTPDSPYLYDLRVELLDGNDKAADAVDSYFGMRKIALGKDEKGDTRVLLNGKPIFQVGPLDQGFWPDGLYTAPTDAALKSDIEMTKKLGFNVTRKHVKVEPARWYFWCDKLGLLVWQDMPSGDHDIPPSKPDLVRTHESARQYELELKQMIDGLHNHPCIVMWVVFNEGWGQFDTERITKWTKEYDASRLVDCASGWNDRKVGDVMDIHVYPGPGSPPPEPNRAAVLGEFGGLGLGVDGHTWSNKTWGYRGTASREDLTRKYERLLRTVWKHKEADALCAAIYTQITDVETEANGLLTYDREVIKVDVDRVAAANRGDFSRMPQIRTLAPTSVEKPQTWRYTLEKPDGAWTQPDFKDGEWKNGPGGFGTKGTPGTYVRTEWKTDNIWLRREFTLGDEPLADVVLTMHHDDDVEVYVNGILTVKAEGYTTDYEEQPLPKEARQSLRPGRNVLAVHCLQKTGGQYIDLGLFEIKKGR
jgi:beta-galactosidase/beta-glucuronidase